MKRAALAVMVLACVACKKKEQPGPAPAASPPPTTLAGSATPPPAPPQATGSAGSATAAPTVAASAGGTIANEAAKALALQCKQAARDIQGNEGTSWYMRCPPCTMPASVWGSDLYTDDSAVCLAAIHSGAITSNGGLVLVTWAAGQPTYVGSARNGITTADYGSWGRSFFVQSVDAQGHPTSQPVVPPPAGTIRMSCAMAAQVWTRDEPVRVRCPPGCASGSVWGSDVYSADSAMCVAAVHAGLTTVEKGGEVQLTMGGHIDKLVGSTRNGVTSQNYGAYDRTFKLSK